MARFLDIHPDNPQARLVGQVVEALRADQLIAYPTDSGYALGAQLGNREGRDRIVNLLDLVAGHGHGLGDVGDLRVRLEMLLQPREGEFHADGSPAAAASSDRDLTPPSRSSSTASEPVKPTWTKRQRMKRQLDMPTSPAILVSLRGR